MPVILENLRFIRSSGSSMRTPYDGIFQDENGWWHITFCHGSELGLALNINNFSIDVEPENLRNTLLYKMNIDISKDEKIFISPCHPRVVREIFGERLDKNNIFLDVPDWEGDVTFEFFDGHSVPFVHQTDRNSDFPIKVLFEEVDVLLKNSYNSTKTYAEDIFRQNGVAFL